MRERIRKVREEHMLILMGRRRGLDDDGVHRRWKYSVQHVSRLPDDAAKRLRSNFGMMARFEAEPDGFEQEKMLASLYFEYMAERFKDDGKLRDAVLSALRENLGLDLSVEATFGESAIRRIARPRAEREAMRGVTVRAFDELSRQSGSREDDDMVDGVVNAVDGLGT